MLYLALFSMEGDLFFLARLKKKDFFRKKNAIIICRLQEKHYFCPVFKPRWRNW